MGGSGFGQHIKAANRIMEVNNMIGLCESLIYGHKAGLELNQMIEILQGGGGSSFVLKNFAPTMLQREFYEGYSAEFLLKDLRNVLDECEKMDIETPGTKLAYDLYD